jgi:hypothetical protein
MYGGTREELIRYPARSAVCTTTIAGGTRPVASTNPETERHDQGDAAMAAESRAG